MPDPIEYLSPHVEPLRIRILALPEAQSATFWGAYDNAQPPLPESLNPEYNPEGVDWVTFSRIAAILRSCERADREARERAIAALEHWTEPSDRFLVREFLRAFDCPLNPMMSAGQAEAAIWLLTNQHQWWPEPPDADLAALPELPAPPPVKVDKVLTTPAEDALDDVPTGTVAELKEWVNEGGDPRLAARAEVQRKGAKARKSLMSWLEKQITPDEKNEPPETSSPVEVPPEDGDESQHRSDAPRENGTVETLRPAESPSSGKNGAEAGEGQEPPPTSVLIAAQAALRQARRAIDEALEVLEDV